jgi:hypothetical protein
VRFARASRVARVIATAHARIGRKRDARRLSSDFEDEHKQKHFASRARRFASSAIYPHAAPRRVAMRLENRKPLLLRHFRIDQPQSFFTRLEQLQSRSRVRIARRDAGLRICTRGAKMDLSRAFLSLCFRRAPSRDTVA